MVGHLAELDLCIHYEFRKGSDSPRARNLEFIQDCERAMPPGHRMTQTRIDSAGYNAELFNYLDKKQMRFTITGVKSEKLLKEFSCLRKVPEKSLIQQMASQLAARWLKGMR